MILEVTPEQERNWKKSLRIPDKELFEIFPEAKKIIPQKIKEWNELKDEFKKEIRERLKGIREYKCDDFSKWFFRELLKYQYAPDLLEIRSQIMRLNRLILVMNGREQRGGVTDFEIQTAKEYPIENLIDEPLRRSGKSLKGLCPFHSEKTPSFFVYPNNKYHCFSCGNYGDSISFIQKQRGLNFTEAVKFLATENFTLTPSLSPQGRGKN